MEGVQSGWGIWSLVQAPFGSFKVNKPLVTSSGPSKMDKITATMLLTETSRKHALPPPWTWNWMSVTLSNEQTHGSVVSQLLTKYTILFGVCSHGGTTGVHVPK